MLEGGLLLQALTDAQHEIVSSIEDRGGKGSLKVDFKFKADRTGQVLVVADVTVKPSPEERGSTLFFSKNGNLTRDNPDQDDMFTPKKDTH